MRNSGSREVIVVLGMHRSGTSAITGLLESFGLSIGKNVMPPTPNNPKGYFENKRIVDFNNLLLKISGVKWHEVFLLPCGFFSRGNLFKGQGKEAKELILEEFDFKGPLLIKDPRMCVLLPLWQPVFKSLNLTPSYILVNRKPAGVIRSLKQRDNLPAFRSEILWLYYNLCAELYSREGKRIFVNYEHLLDDPSGVVKILKAHLPFLKNDRHGGVNQYKKFIDPALNHHNHHHPNENLYFPETRQLNDIFNQACNEVQNQVSTIILDEIRNRLTIFLQELIYGYHTPDYSLETHLRDLINPDRKIDLNRDHLQLERLKRQLEDERIHKDEPKQSFAFHLKGILKKQAGLLKIIFLRKR